MAEALSVQPAGADRAAPPAELLDVRGHDLYRLYADEPTSGGWREMREPVSNMKYWNHVTLRITTWSLVEVLRMNGLEEFLLIGEWSVFTCVPEDTATYEDIEWGLDLYANDRLEGKPVARLKRGTVVASTGMPRPGVCEMLVPSSEDFVMTLYSGYRFPKDSGKRVMQRLPSSQHVDSMESLAPITVPTWIILPGAAGEAGLPVTQDRDPRSAELGRLPGGTSVFLNLITGTRAQVSRVVDGHRAVWGGWISILGVDATPSIERILEETEQMKLAAHLAEHIKQLEEAGMLDPAAMPTLPNDDPFPKRKKPPKVEPEHSTSPPVRAKVPVAVTEQRPTVTGGWRQVTDPVWGRPQFVEPISGRMTWGLSEVLKTGGLDDLLLSRDWEMCVVDPLAVEVMKDKTWTFEIFADPGLTGDPLLARAKGDFVIIQVFEPKQAVAQVLLHPAKEGEEAASGYARYRLHDGRPLLRAVLPPAVDEYAAAAAAAGGPEPEHDGADPPSGPVLEGPFFAVPPGSAPDLPVSIGQDIESDKWARLPRGYCIRTFADVVGLRARLPDLEGGGWVSVFGSDGTPYFRKQPTPPPVLELPGTMTEDEQDATLPIVWPQLGVIRPPKEAAVALPPQPHSFPDLLKRLGGGRAVCDWQRIPLLPDGGHCYKSPLTFAQTTLDNLLTLKIWKATIVEAEELHIREYADPRSKHLATLPACSLVVAEWVAPGDVVRLLLPGQPDADNPLHAWTDLGSASGSALVPLAPGTEFWIEPKGGHLSEEEQKDENIANVTKVWVREEKDPASKVIGYLQRGDAVQLAEIQGRFTRIVHSRRVLLAETVPNGSGWLDIFDEAGWSILKARRPGEVHIEEIRKKAVKEMQEEMPKLKTPSSSRRVSKRSTVAPRTTSKASVASISMPGALALVPLTEDRGEEGELEAMSSEGVAELPPLLWQIGEMEGRSVCLRDWREHVDPVWGRRYFVNRWSGQIIHKLANFGVAYPSVRLTLYFSNLSMEVLRETLETGPEVDKRVAEICKAFLQPLAALADVPEDLVDVTLKEGPDEEAAEGPGSPSSHSVDEDSIMGGTAGLEAKAAEEQEKRGFRAVARFRAPGTRAAWASAGLKRAMADASRFTSHVVALFGNVPGLYALRVDEHEGIELTRADLEEVEIPRTATCLRPPPEPEPPPPPPIDDDIREMSRNMVFAKPKLLQMPNRTLGPPTANAQVLAEGLCALPEPTLEEVGLWKCYLGDAGAVSLANALSTGIGAKLHTLLLDENRIGAAGATALGAGLGSCKLLRELGIARNPLGPGFAGLVIGLGSALVVFDASDASLNDTGAFAAAHSIPSWPLLRSLRLGGNANLGRLGVEALVRAAVGCKSLRLADIKGCSPKAAAEWPRYSRMLEEAGRDQGLVRL